MKMLLVTLVMFYFAFITVNSQDLDDHYLSDICQAAAFQSTNETSKCSACIQVPNAKCAWCADPAYDTNRNYRCDLLKNHLEFGCKSEHIISPVSMDVEILKNELLRNAGNHGTEPVQLQPQAFKIRLRLGETASIQIKFRQALDYPLDLYYLMDLSYSMKDDKDKLTQLADKLAFEMTQLTKDFQLGFGSFVDKKVIPFIDPRHEYANVPCTGCDPPYGFRHHMSLTKDTKMFQTLVNQSKVSGNLDAPEGGLDALVQTLACKERIGWRDRSRKTIVFSTDASFHFAGDGRLGGLVEPNDGSCHLNKDGYDTNIEQDYASLELLHRLIRKMQANILFAVTSEVKLHYDRLRQALSQDISAAVGILANDSSNVVELVVNEFKKISEYVAFINTLPPDQESIRLSASMICKNGLINASNACDGIHLGDSIIYNLNITLIDCHKSANLIKFNVGPSGLGESVQISVEKMCDCECQNKEIKLNSPECDGKGKFECGVCQCNPPFAGQKCECDTSALPGKTTTELEYRCRRDNDTRTPICEGRGFCECGECRCQKPQVSGHQIYGKYCECDNFMCPRAFGIVCGGRGRCGCDQRCQCEDGWTGIDCSCTNSQESCRAPNGLICNGKGTCECGLCKCIDQKFSGRTCEQCPTCPPPCVQFKDCVLRFAFKSGPLTDSQFQSRCKFDFRKIKDLPREYENKTLSEFCQFVDNNDGCTFYFTFFEFNETSAIVWIKEDKDCPLIEMPVAITIGVIAGIVLIGVFLLIAWKLLTIWHDRREYERFQDEIKDAKWATEQNPIFQSPVNRYQNPMYGMQQQESQVGQESISKM